MHIAPAFEDLADAYISMSKYIILEHAENGSCTDREGHGMHDLLHDTMRSISHTILTLGYELHDHPRIRAYNTSRSVKR